MSRAERFRRHLRISTQPALLGAISTVAVVAGFLSAAGEVWPLLAYVTMIGGLTALLIGLLALSGQRLWYLLLVPGATRARSAEGRPPQLELVALSAGAPTRSVAAASYDDPVYGAGLRALLAPCQPLIVIPSNQRDVSKQHELPYPLFAGTAPRTSARIDLREFGIPIPPYEFVREVPDGVQDVDHTLAVKDLMFIPALASALLSEGVTVPTPAMWPEHCVDPALLAERDVVVVGGPDTNFWHGVLFEAVAREFSHPPSSVPLALDLREGTGRLPVYGSRYLSVRMADLATVFPRETCRQIELDERVYPTYGMVLACRNPLAAAHGRSRWCVFVAGTRSLGTSGAVLALTAMLEAMRRDPQLNFFSSIATTSPNVAARVSAVLCRTVEVERSAIRLNGAVVPRQRRRLPLEGLDPYYSDSYVPTEVEYLSYLHGPPRWEPAARLAARPPPAPP